MLGYISPTSRTRLGLALVVSVLSAGCQPRQDSNISGERQSALDKASKAIIDDGHAATNYTHQEFYDTNAGQWTVTFQPAAKPRPPGGDLIVQVNLTNGETKLMHGQ